MLELALILGSIFYVVWLVRGLAREHREERRKAAETEALEAAVWEKRQRREARRAAARRRYDDVDDDRSGYEIWAGDSGASQSDYDSYGDMFPDGDTYQSNWPD